MSARERESHGVHAVEKSGGACHRDYRRAVALAAPCASATCGDDMRQRGVRSAAGSERPCEPGQDWLRQNVRSPLGAASGYPRAS